MPTSSSSSSAAASHPSPAPAPATAAGAGTPRRRRRQLLPASSSSASFSSPSTSPFSFFPPSSPSPFHRFLPSPLRASSVPFSWEHRPGIPKTPARPRSCSNKSGKKPLPLPPSLLLSSSVPGVSGSGADASSVFPAEYAAAMQQPEHARGRLGGSIRVRRRRRRARVADALAEWLSVLGLYRSCKRAASCFAAKIKAA